MLRGILKVRCVGLGVLLCAAAPLAHADSTEVRRLEFDSSTGVGAFVEHQATVNGLPVVGQSTVTRLSENGDVLWRTGTERNARRHVAIDTTPSLSLGQAVDRVGAEGTAELVVDAQPVTGPRLAYRVHTVDRVNTEVIRAFVDAKTGRVYRRERLSWDARASVFAANPIRTPDLTTVELSSLAENAQNLTDDRIAAISCLDPQMCRFDEEGEEWYYACEFGHAAEADTRGDFYYDFKGDTVPDDALAEVSGYYHVARSYEAMRELTGVQNLVNDGLLVVANYRSSAEPLACEEEKFVGEQSLVPFDNAVFIPGGFGLLDTPHNAILLGQGTDIDYAFDGDVVIHEFGHGFHHTVAPELSRGFMDLRGFNPTPSGLGEGYADLFALALTGDSKIGEYAGGERGHIRDLDNDARCPDDLTGESHADSEIFTGGIYEARQAVARTAAQKKLYDAAILRSATGLGAYDGFDAAATAAVREIGVALGASAAARARQILADRGLFGCSDRVVDAAPRRFLWLDGYFNEGLTPAAVQFKYELTERATRIGAFAGYVGAANGGDDAVEAEEVIAVLRRGDTPIAWRKAGDAIEGNYQHEAQFKRSGEEADDPSAVALFEGDFAPGTYYIQFVHKGETATVFAGMQFAHAAGDALAGNHPLTPEARVSFLRQGLASADGAELAEAGDDAPVAGCAAAPGAGEGAISFALLGFALLIARRRRR